MLWSKAIGAGGAGVVVEGWNVSTAVFNQSFSISAQETLPVSLFFKPDGTKMYVMGYAGDDVNEYSLSTSWDVSTAVFSQLKSISAQEITPLGLFFKPDGLKMYVTGNAGDDINEYSLSTSWDVSTASYVQNFNVSVQDTNPAGVFFKPDGTKMYVTGQATPGINEYSLSTSWDVSTASYVKRLSLSGVISGLFFKPDGLKMYFCEVIGDDIKEYGLSTAWDISTASYTQNLVVAAKEANPQGVFFKPDGTKMYVVGSQSDAVHEYDLTA